MKTIKESLTSLVAATLLGACGDKTRPDQSLPDLFIHGVQESSTISDIDHDGFYDMLVWETWNISSPSYGSPNSGHTTRTYFKEGVVSRSLEPGLEWYVVPQGFFTPYHNIQEQRSKEKSIQKDR